MCARVLTTTICSALALSCGGDTGTSLTGTQPPPPSVVWAADSVRGQPAADSSAIYVGTSNHRLLSLDRQSGALRWAAQTSAATSSPLAAGNVVLARGNAIWGDYDLFAFDAATGARRWVFNPKSQGVGGYAPGVYRSQTDGSVVYAGSGSGYAYAIDGATGAAIWATSLASDSNSSAYDPVIDSTTVYIAVRHFTNPLSGAIYALNRQTGVIRWSHVSPPSATPGGGAGPLNSIVLYQDLVIDSDEDGRVYALDRASGVERWSAPRLSDVHGLDDQRPLVLSGSAVIVGSTAPTIVAYDAATGQQRWRVSSTNGSTLNPLVSAGPDVFEVYLNGKLIDLDGGTGALQWSQAAPNGGVFLPSPLVLGLTIYAPSSVGVIVISR